MLGPSWLTALSCVQAMKANEALRGRVEEVLKEEEVKRVSAAANEAARSAFGKAKWLSFLKGGKASLLPPLPPTCSGAVGRHSGCSLGLQKDAFKKPGLASKTADGDKAKDNVAAAEGKGGEQPGAKDKQREKEQPGASASGTPPASSSPAAKEGSGAEGGTEARDSKAEGMQEGAGTERVGSRTFTLPPSRIQQIAGQKLLVRDLISALERNPYLCKSTRLAQLQTSA